MTNKELVVHFHDDPFGPCKPEENIISNHFEYLSPTNADEDEMGRLLDLIDAEWRSDPSSVACFDLRIVEDVRKALASWRKRKEATDRERRRFKSL